MKKYMLAAALLLLSTTSYAATHYSKVTSVGAYNSQWAVFNLETSIAAEATLPASCTTRRQTISFDKSTAHGQDMLTIVLTAFASGKRVHIQFFTSVCGGDGLYPLANRVDVLRD